MIWENVTPCQWIIIWNLFFNAGGYFCLNPRTLQVLFCLCPVKVKNRYPMDTCVYCCWPKIGCSQMGYLLHPSIHPSIVSWFSKTKTTDFDEEQICSSPASSSHGWWLANRQTSYHEELIAKKEILLVPAHLLWLWQLSHSLTKVTDSVDSAAMNTSCVMNEPIWSIPRNNCLL